MNIRAAFASLFSSRSKPAKASSPARASPAVRKPGEAGAETPKKPPLTRQLGNLPFKTWNVQPQDDFQLSPDDENNLADGFIYNRKRLDTLVNSSPLKMTPRSCLAGVLLISGVFKAPDQFKDEFDQASDWQKHTSVRGAWRSLVGFGMPENSVLNATTIKVRISLCRMTAERVSPEFLGKFDEAAKILLEQDNVTWSHGVTRENYWEVITAIQTLAWNELNGSAS